MGYQTRYTLETDAETAPVCPCCGNTGSLSFQELLIKEITYDPFEEPCKWYDWETNMRAFSLKYPDVLFTLNGEGEETGDIWTAYIKNGKCQLEKAKIQVADFDPAKLE